MALITTYPNGSAMLSVRLADNVFSYMIGIGYEVSDLKYEVVGGIQKTISGTITEITDSYIKVDNTKINPDNIIRLSNRANTIVEISSINKIDTDWGGDKMDTTIDKDVTMVISADPLIPPPLLEPEYKYPGNEKDPDNFKEPEEEKKKEENYPPDVIIPEDPDPPKVPLVPDPDYNPDKPTEPEIPPDPEKPDTPTPPTPSEPDNPVTPPDPGEEPDDPIKPPVVDPENPDNPPVNPPDKPDNPGTEPDPEKPPVIDPVDPPDEPTPPKPVDPEPDDPVKPPVEPEPDDPVIPSNPTTPEEPEEEEPTEPPFHWDREPIDMDDYVPLTFEKTDLDKDVIYDDEIQKVSYIQANMTAVFRDWFVSFFKPNYFKFIRTKTESTYKLFKTFMKEIYKKDYPLLVIDNNPPEHVDDFIFGTNALNRFNLVDPSHDNIGAKMLYSLPLIETDRISLHYRRTRFRFRFNVLLMERTLNRAIDTHNFLLMNIRHRSQFMLFKKVLNIIPTHIIASIARINGFNKPDDKFMDWINAHSIGSTIIRRILPGGKSLYFAESTAHIQVEVPDDPDKDSPERSEAIEIAARVSDTFIFTVDLPSEYICTMDHSVVKQYVRKYEGEDPEVHYITSTNIKGKEMPLEIGEFKLFNKVDAMIQDENDNALNMLDVVRQTDLDIHKTAVTLLNDDNTTLDKKFMKVVVIVNGVEYKDITFSKEGILTILNADYSKLYRIYLYINYRILNLYSNLSSTEFIGTIHKEPY